MSFNHHVKKIFKLVVICIKLTNDGFRKPFGEYLFPFSLLFFISFLLVFMCCLFTCKEYRLRSQSMRDQTSIQYRGQVPRVIVVIPGNSREPTSCCNAMKGTHHNAKETRFHLDILRHAFTRNINKKVRANNNNNNEKEQKKKGRASERMTDGHE